MIAIGDALIAGVTTMLVTTAIVAATDATVVRKLPFVMMSGSFAVTSIAETTLQLSANARNCGGVYIVCIAIGRRTTAMFFMTAMTADMIGLVS